MWSRSLSWLTLSCLLCLFSLVKVPAFPAVLLRGVLPISSFRSIVANTTDDVLEYSVRIGFTCTPGLSGMELDIALGLTNITIWLLAMGVPESC